MIQRISHNESKKEACDRLYSKIITRSGFCLRCGRSDLLTCSHIVPRRFSATRTDLSNGQCICMPCARRLTDNPNQFKLFINETIGAAAFDALWLKARTVTKMDWGAELIRLKGLDN